MPLFPGEFREKLEVICTELGSFPYELLLTAIPALPERPMNLNCTLGCNVTALASIENKASVKASFNCEIDNSDFKVEKVVTLESGERRDVPIVFEPTSLGTVSATLAITSPVAGNFSFPIIGKCGFPKPQGPFILTPGGSVNINFKNIFRVTKKFSVTVNLPVFTVKKTADTVQPKKELAIKVTLAAAGKKTMTFPIYGKLVVSCDDMEMKNIQWTYFLKGVIES
ncbi:hydrocephalus-inducing protein-like [Schistocerca serialis cubense]|uniref:hydrocephalus-inducing protein-like n=1 Tax=Schistocerca serialis cubense TaxID=2023355 RepID=UPI00214E3A3B|nr:hydrocephalus-inducing protein-like [Schistocerca serialis cubense]